jgi:hypothetical protein
MSSAKQKNFSLKLKEGSVNLKEQQATTEHQSVKNKKI